MVCLGKSLSGGFMPISAVLANNNIMDHIQPGEHGSTFGGNPLAARTASVAIDVIFEEKLSENSAKMGKLFLDNLKKIFDSNGKNGKHIKEGNLLKQSEKHSLWSSLVRKILSELRKFKKRLGKKGLLRL